MWPHLWCIAAPGSRLRPDHGPRAPGGQNVLSSCVWSSARSLDLVSCSIFCSLGADTFDASLRTTLDVAAGHGGFWSILDSLVWLRSWLLLSARAEGLRRPSRSSLTRVHVRSMTFQQLLEFFHSKLQSLHLRRVLNFHVLQPGGLLLAHGSKLHNLLVLGQDLLLQA